MKQTSIKQGIMSGAAAMALLLSTAATQADLPGSLTETVSVVTGPVTNLANDLVDSTGLLPGDLITDQYIVMLDPNITGLLGALDLDQAIATLLATVGGGDVLHTYAHALTGMAVQMTDLQASLLSALPGVLHVERDQVVQIVATQNEATWGLDRIDQRHLPLDNIYVYPDSAGAGVNVYILDTGLRATHQEFSGRVITGRNFASNGGGFLGLGGSTDPDNTNDCNGHGTHVASTAVGSVYGVAKSASVAPVRVLDCGGSGANSGVIAGVDWVAGNHTKPAVANMSLGGGNSTALDEAVRNAVAAGVTFVVAAGNSNANACTGSPNRVAEALTVGATANNDSRSSFSNFGSCVDVFAPGTNITAAWFQSDTQLRTISGTSMAAPHVAGAAALYLGKESSATPDEVGTVLLADATVGVLSSIGSGSPNLLLYVDPADNGNPVDRPPVAAFTVECEALVCSFDASGSTDDVGVAAWDWQFGDGNTASGEQVQHTYAANGDYTVSLTVTDTANQTAERSETVRVNDGQGPDCPDCTSRTGTLNNGQQATHQFDFGGGVVTGILLSPAGASFDVFLESRSCFLLLGCSWSTVATGQGTAAEKQISTRVSGGTYRWRVRATTGSGAYELLTNP
ncbi:S8 family serine peptidase [Alcanivorax limicola]|uniref:S8 family serine peptidase n=1 Tax=Alcanivorax limicola TaxID=2874102 RepID=UPI001CBCE9AA|nr:S8 family serine peptidase [Alcanivorax limicola]